MPKINVEELPAHETYFTEEELAKLLKTSERTLQGWRLKGGGPDYLKAGALVRYPLSRFKKFEQENLHSNTSEYAT